MDYQALLYNPIYNTLAVAATLVTATGVTASVKVKDETKGVAVADKTLIETVKPGCFVRAAELASNGIARADLTDGSITFNGSSWRIKATQPKPSPNGEADGEYLLILLSEGE